MFGSKNSELTRKYDSNWFELITFGLSSRWRVAYSTKPIPTNATRERREHGEALPRRAAASTRTRASSANSSANGT